jgi:FHA domain
MPVTLGTAQRPRLAHNVATVRSSPRSVSVVTPESHFHDPAATDEIDEDLLILVDDDQNDASATTPATVDAPVRAPLLIEGRSLRYYQQADDGTLEFLPGRLEVIGGVDRGQEIHFVRPIQEELPSVTFGRLEGPPHRHVQLLDRTVSRQHARMTYAESRWHLTNLSRTNPVQLNGLSLPDDGPAITLATGDRIEMGAVVFVFKEK